MKRFVDHQLDAVGGDVQEGDLRHEVVAAEDHEEHEIVDDAARHVLRDPGVAVLRDVANEQLVEHVHVEDVEVLQITRSRCSHIIVQRLDVQLLHGIVP